MRKFLLFFVFLACIQAFTLSQNSSLFITKPINTHEHWLFTQPVDTINGNWTYLTPMSKSLYGVNSYYLSSINKIFICGGADSTGNTIRNCYFYNLSTNLYELADSLPMGRCLGKLVMVHDSLFLIGSIGASFNAPDGATYCFNTGTNKWSSKSTMPSPLLIECAVCVWHDTIITIGGSTSGFIGPTDIVRTYDPVSDIWNTSITPFYQPVTTAAAECNGNYIVVLGGWVGTFSNDVIIGGNDTLTSIDNIIWNRLGDAPYPTGVYRVSSSYYNSTMIFGPALYNNITIYNQFWAINPPDTSWHRFLPNPLDSVADFSNFAINSNSDSTYFYIFGGIKKDTNNNPILINRTERFAFGSVPFGLKRISNTIPKEFILYQNYPNPFNPVTTIKFEIPQATSGMKSNTVVKLEVYDVLGRLVKTLVNENEQSGIYTVQFDASNLSSGIYFYRLTSGNYYAARKMIVLK